MRVRTSRRNMVSSWASAEVAARRIPLDAVYHLEQAIAAAAATRLPQGAIALPTDPDPVLLAKLPGADPRPARLQHAPLAEGIHRLRPDVGLRGEAGSPAAAK